jgi:hypothetical protein
MKRAAEMGYQTYRRSGGRVTSFGNYRDAPGRTRELRLEVGELLGASL